MNRRLKTPWACSRICASCWSENYKCSSSCAFATARYVLCNTETSFFILVFTAWHNLWANPNLDDADGNMSTVKEFDDGYYNRGIFSSIALILTHPSIDDEPDNGHQVDDIHVEYHPHSGRAPKISPFGEFTHEHLHMPLAPEADQEPWHPFHTLMDFEVSELALEAALNKDQTIRLIKLLQWVYDKHGKCTLRNYDELRNVWDAAGSRLTLVSPLTLHSPQAKFNMISPIPRHNGLGPVSE